MRYENCGPTEKPAAARTPERWPRGQSGVAGGRSAHESHPDKNDVAFRIEAKRKGAPLPPQGRFRHIQERHALVDARGTC